MVGVGMGVGCDQHRLGSINDGATLNTSSQARVSWADRGNSLHLGTKLLPQFLQSGCVA